LRIPEFVRVENVHSWLNLGNMAIPHISREEMEIGVGKKDELLSVKVIVQMLPVEEIERVAQYSTLNQVDMEFEIGGQTVRYSVVWNIIRRVHPSS